MDKYGLASEVERAVFMEMVTKTRSNQSVNSRMCQEIVNLRSHVLKLQNDKELMLAVSRSMKPVESQEDKPL